MTTPDTSETPAALALWMVDEGAPAPAVDAAALRALAWALKDLGYAAWSSNPARVARVADALGRLRAGDHALDAGAEVSAVAAWIDGIADLTCGRMREATGRFDAAADGFRALGLPLEAARAGVPKIIALSILGLHGEAAAVGEATQRELLALGDRQAASKVSLNLGNLYCRCNDYPLALQHYREAAVLFARIGDHERSVMSDVGMADALASMGDFDESLRICARARMRAGQHGFPVLGALADEAVALVALSRGEYHEALAGLEACRRCYEKLGMPQHLAIAEKQLADVYLEMRLVPEALALLTGALERFAALQMPVEQGWALAQKGRALASLEPPDAGADDAFAAAGALFRAQDVKAGEAMIALAQAELALRRGEAVDAMRFASNARARYEAAHIAEGGWRATAVLADAELMAGRIERSAARFDGALAGARAMRLLSVEVRCLAGRGSAALAGGDVDAARRFFEAAIAAFEEQRRLLQGDDLRDGFLADHLRPYLALLRLALADAPQDGSDQAASAVLESLERFRARVLDERLGSGRALADEVGDVEVGLRARLNWLYRRMQRLDGAEPDGGPIDEARRIEHELLEHGRRRLFASLPRDAGPVADRAFDADTLQRALDPAEALVEYGVQDDVLFACVVTRDRVTLVNPVAPWPAVTEALRAARFQIETLRHGTMPVARHLDVLVRRAQVRMATLHALLWAPLAALLDGRSRVVVVPHDQLGTLPFAALYDGERYVAETCALAIAPSAQVFLRGRSHRPVAARRVLAVGETSRLPQAASEVAFVAGLFDDATMLAGPDATLARVEAEAGGADVLHLACHAQFREDNPRFSALHLVDGALTVDAIEQWHLRSATVVLSACETGLADQGRGDEMVGLVRAFLLAGASRVVGSLWPVDDAVTACFMDAFYRELRAGGGPAAALRFAQRTVLIAHPHPSHWAAFAVYGGF